MPRYDPYSRGGMPGAPGMGMPYQVGQQPGMGMGMPAGLPGVGQGAPPSLGMPSAPNPFGGSSGPMMPGRGPTGSLGDIYARQVGGGQQPQGGQGPLGWGNMGLMDKIALGAGVVGEIGNWWERRAMRKEEQRQFDEMMAERERERERERQAGARFAEAWNSQTGRR